MNKTQNFTNSDVNDDLCEYSILTETPSELPFVSVIVPVFNDPIRLTTCLEALENQTYPKEFYEVIVVDNGSDEPIDTVVSKFKQARAAVELKPGSYHARNTGISLASGSVLGFTDADCIPAKDWIAKGVENLSREPGCGLVGGKIEFFFQNPARPTPAELYDKVMAFAQEDDIRQNHYSATANLFTYRHTIDDVGLFNASVLKSGGDLEWGQRVYASGYKLVYAHEVCVRHPARGTYREQYVRAIRVAGGLYDGRNLNQRSYFGFDKDLVKLLMPPVRTTLKVLLDNRLTGVKQKIQAAVVVPFVKYSMALERFRLNLGGHSRRE